MAAGDSRGWAFSSMLLRWQSPTNTLLHKHTGTEIGVKQPKYMVMAHLVSFVANAKGAFTSKRCSHAVFLRLTSP